MFFLLLERIVFFLLSTYNHSIVIADTITYCSSLAYILSFPKNEVNATCIESRNMSWAIYIYIDVSHRKVLVLSKQIWIFLFLGGGGGRGGGSFLLKSLPLFKKSRVGITVAAFFLSSQRYGHPTHGGLGRETLIGLP